MKYTVDLTKIVTATVEIEAASKEDAVEEACDLAQFDDVNWEDPEIEAVAWPAWEPK